MASIKEAGKEIQQAYYNAYFIISTGEKSADFFERERLTFWADDLIDFIVFTIESVGRLTIYINVGLYQQQGMEYLINLANFYKDELRKIKRLELYGVYK